MKSALDIQRHLREHIDAPRVPAASFKRSDLKLRLKSAILAFTPPIVVSGLYRAYSARPNSALFDGNDGLFRELLTTTKVYAEYGCGASTAWVLTHSDAPVYSVDSSLEWVSKVKSQAKEKDRVLLKIQHVNLGALAKWGRPLGYEKSENFVTYTDWIWKQKQTPDTVLIDGRFRVCCFLTSLKYAPPGTRILFDDYVSRPHYHYVERFLKPIKTQGRQALFVTKSRYPFDQKTLDKAIDHFRFVME